MNHITIYHNPRCSKSREALGIVQRFASDHDAALNVIEYLKTPLAAKDLQALQHKLEMPAREMVRENEEEFASLNLAEANDAALLQAIVAHPKLMQRPIVVYREQAIIARPPERLHEFLKSNA